MIDLKKLKPNSKVRLLDGSILEIRGSFMSTTGLVFTAKSKPGSIVDRNIHVEDVAEVIEAGKKENE